uniref:Uncharacterized protein n=1 Tax=Oryza nivara TaxID=4536 RepID=A0A0E0HA34_ORYNI
MSGRKGMIKLCVKTKGDSRDSIFFALMEDMNPRKILYGIREREREREQETHIPNIEQRRDSGTETEHKLDWGSRQRASSQELTIDEHNIPLSPMPHRRH